MSRKEVIALARVHQVWDPRVVNEGKGDPNMSIDAGIMREAYGSYFSLPSTKGLSLGDLFTAFCEDRNPFPILEASDEEQQEYIIKLRKYQTLLTDDKLN